MQTFVKILLKFRFENILMRTHFRIPLGKVASERATAKPEKLFTSPKGSSRRSQFRGDLRWIELNCLLSYQVNG